MTIDIVDWLTNFVADLLDISPAEVPLDAAFADLGVDSATTLVLAADLSTCLGRPVTPGEVGEHPSITALAAHLARSRPTPARALR